MIKLQFRDDPGNYTKLQSDSVSIGRDASNRLVIDDASVSDFHAEIITSGDQQLYVIDLLSAAGTFVNEERISGRHPLSAWDHIRVGTIELEVNDPNICRPENWALYAQSDLLSRQFYTLKARTIIGRDANCDFTIDNHLLSRKHTELIIENDRLRVVDLESGNGTYLNGKRISSAEAFSGDELCFDQERYIIKGPTKKLPVVEDSARDLEVTMLRPAVDLQALGVAEPEEDFLDQTATLHGPDSQSCLVEQTNFLPDARYRIEGIYCTIGRKDTNDIVLSDKSVSKRHAVFSYQGKHWRIEDQESRNGIKVNGKICRSAELNHGDSISIGRIEFMFQQV